VPRKGDKFIAQNRKARHDYFIEDVYEAGIALRGTEVKAMRQGKCNLRDCYAAVANGEVTVHGMHISAYEQGNIYNVDPLRPKKLLLHKAEIRKLNQAVMQKGLTLIPLSVYLKDSLMKLELGVCRGKKQYDKRDDMRDRDVRREIDRHMKDRRRGG
jgi:SsrA-binding protein